MTTGIETFVQHENRPDLIISGYLIQNLIRKLLDCTNHV